MKSAECFRLTKIYRLPIFLIGLNLAAGGYEIACAQQASLEAEPLLLLKTGNAADLIIDRNRQIIFSSDDCKIQNSFKWVDGGSDPAQPVRRLQVQSKVSENLAGKPLSFSLNYDMEISRDRVRLFLRSQQGAIEVPVTSSTYTGRSPCR